MRLHVPILNDPSALAVSLPSWLKEQDWIINSHINYHCASLIIEYEPEHFKKLDECFRFFGQRVRAPATGATPSFSDGRWSFPRSPCIDSIALAPLIARGLSVLSAQGHYGAIFDFCSDATRKFLEEHQGAIRNRIVKSSFRWLPGRMDERLADAVLSELIATLLAARNALQHPWHIEGRETVDRLIIKLAEDQERCDQFERFKARLLDQSVVQGYLEWLCKEIETRVRAETNSKVGLLGSGVDQGLNALANWLDGSEHHRHLINRWVRDLSLQLVISSCNEIGTFVAEIVGSWETETLVQRLALQVGKDLQYIRINDTWVGGMAELLIFILGRFFQADITARPAAAREVLDNPTCRLLAAKLAAAQFAKRGGVERRNARPHAAPCVSD